MNLLLWRAEYASHGESGSLVPAELVWRKILTAPDSSSLAIFQHAKKIGFCHWSTSIGDEWAKTTEEDALEEGRAPKVAGYRIQLEGNLSIPQNGIRARFDGNLGLKKDETWQDLNIRLNLKPASWEIHSSAAEKAVKLKIEEDQARFERTFKFQEFQNPAGLLAEFGGPGGAALIGGLGSLDSFGPVIAGSANFNPRWEARQDWLKIGRSVIRTYRLRTRLLDKYEIVIFASRVGEILRVELPGEVVLMNDQLAMP